MAKVGKPKGYPVWNKGLKGVYSMKHGSQFKKGCTPWNKGILYVQLLGSNNPNWVSDRSRLVKSEKKHLDTRYKIWMNGVKNRDGWKCKISNIDCNGKLESHHILDWKNYPELRYEINNGITLCHAHHPRGRKMEAKLSPYFQQLVAQVN
jgi:hypothetical protein